MHLYWPSLSLPGCALSFAPLLLLWSRRCASACLRSGPSVKRTLIAVAWWWSARTLHSPEKCLTMYRHVTCRIKCVICPRGSWFCFLTLCIRQLMTFMCNAQNLACSVYFWIADFREGYPFLELRKVKTSKLCTDTRVYSREDILRIWNSIFVWRGTFGKDKETFYSYNDAADYIMTWKHTKYILICQYLMKYQVISVIPFWPTNHFKIIHKMLSYSVRQKSTELVKKSFIASWFNF